MTRTKVRIPWWFKTAAFIAVSALWAVLAALSAVVFLCIMLGAADLGHTLRAYWGTASVAVLSVVFGYWSYNTAMNAWYTYKWRRRA